MHLQALPSLVREWMVLSLPFLLPSITDIKRDIQAKVDAFKGDLTDLLTCDTHR